MNRQNCQKSKIVKFSSNVPTLQSSWILDHVLSQIHLERLQAMRLWLNTVAEAISAIRRTTTDSYRCDIDVTTSREVTVCLKTSMAAPQEASIAAASITSIRR